MKALKSPLAKLVLADPDARRQLAAFMDLDPAEREANPLTLRVKRPSGETVAISVDVVGAVTFF